jgi:hypothetical protein
MIRYSDEESEMVILDENDGITDTTRRPLCEEERNRILQRLERQAEWRKLMQDEGQSNENEGKV